MASTDDGKAATLVKMGIVLLAGWGVSYVIVDYLVKKGVLPPAGKRL